MWILPVLSFALIFHGGFSQINPAMLQYLATNGGGGGAGASGGLDFGTLMMMQNGGEAAAPLMALNALNRAGGGSGAQLAKMAAILGPEAMRSILPPGMPPHVAYLVLSQNQGQTTTPATVPAMPKSGNATRPTTKTAGGPDMSRIMQMAMLGGGENIGAIAAMLGGGGNMFGRRGSSPANGPSLLTTNPMTILSPEDYQSLLQEGAGAHPALAARYCTPLPLKCKADLMTLMCPDKITLYDPQTMFVCKQCPKCRHQVMMDMLNPAAQLRPGRGGVMGGKRKGRGPARGGATGGPGGPAGRISQLVSSLLGKPGRRAV